MKFTGERVVPYAMQCRPDLMRDHLVRYAWALNYVAGQKVVDLGCGTGYGSFVLSWVADNVTGLDICPNSISFARSHFDGVTFEICDLNTVRRLPPADVYIAFESLEHLDNPWRLLPLISDSTLLWSLPIKHHSEYHKHVFDLHQIADFIPGSKLLYQSVSHLSISPSGVPAKHVVGVSKL